MKHIFTLAIMAFLLISYSNAQTVLTRSNHAPEIGDMITSVYIDELPVIDPGPAGGNQTWDFSAYSGGDSETSTFIDPEGTLWGGQVNSNIAIQEDFKSFMVTYFNVTNSVFQTVAVGSNDEEIGDYLSVFDDNMDLMRFPFAYGDSFEDTYGFFMEMSGFRLVTTGTSSFEADAWGTVITPNGTFNNVLRVKLVTNEITETYINDVLVDSSDETYTTYEWYSESCVAAVASLEIDAEYPGECSLSFSGMGTGLEDIIVDNSVAWPNPAVNTITIDFSVFEYGSDVKIYSCTGVEVANFTAGNSTRDFAVTNLSEGIYFVVGSNAKAEIINEKIVIIR